MQAIYEQYVQNANQSNDQEKSRIRAVRKLIDDARREEESYLAAIGSAREDYRDILVGRAQEANDSAVEAMKELEELEAMVVQRDQQLSLQKRGAHPAVAQHADPCLPALGPHAGPRSQCSRSDPAAWDGGGQGGRTLAAGDEWDEGDEGERKLRSIGGAVGHTGTETLGDSQAPAAG